MAAWRRIRQRNGVIWHHGAAAKEKYHGVSKLRAAAGAALRMRRVLCAAAHRCIDAAMAAMASCINGGMAIMWRVWREKSYRQ